MNRLPPSPRPGTAPPTVSASSPSLDEPGHDPAAYDWGPVLKKRRKDGWSPDKQSAFIEALADSGSAATAARYVGMSESSAYRLRRVPGAEAFDRAWGEASDEAAQTLPDAAFARAPGSTDKPVCGRPGHPVRLQPSQEPTRARAGKEEG